jgi:hypothetical protein
MARFVPGMGVGLQLRVRHSSIQTRVVALEDEMCGGI